MDVQVLRFTVFTASDVTADRGTWWRDVVGQEPSEGDEKPQEGTWRQWGHVARVGDEVALLLANGPGRIDWVFQGMQTDIRQTAPIGALRDVVDEGLAVLRPWLISAAPRATRVAVAVRSIVATGSVADVNQGLARLVPLEIAPETRDFRFRSNLRGVVKPAEGQTIPVNRIVEWAAQHLIEMRLSADAEGDTGVVATRIPDNNALVDAEVNTVVGELDATDGDDLARLMDAVASEARRLSETGFEGFSQ